MKRSYKILLLVLFFLVCAALTALVLSTQNVPVLHPKGMIAEKQRDLFYTASLLMFIVVIPAYIMAIAFAWRYREDNKKAKYTPDWEHSYTAEVLWWGVPCVIIVFLSFLTWTSTHELNPYKPIVNGKKPLTVQVVALEWKWLFIYPEQGIATVNYLQIPEQTPIAFEITAQAPMNSFWIPQLGGQIYAMPAMRTQLHLIANEVGTYRGLSANLSGTGFAGMYFPVHSTTQEDFDEWVSSVKGSSQNLGIDEYLGLVKPSEYNPSAFYELSKTDLFEWILNQYKGPQQSGVMK
jgi:cytochrome o ubiquinol oxidase subunit 2